MTTNHHLDRLVSPLIFAAIFFASWYVSSKLGFIPGTFSIWRRDDPRLFALVRTFGLVVAIACVGYAILAYLGWDPLSN